MNDILTIQGSEVRVTTPEGKIISMPLDQFLAQIAPAQIDTGGLILPDGVKAAFTRGRTTVWVYEAPPRVYCLKWVAKDSPAHYGPGAQYRLVRLALPYVVLLAVFAPGPHGQPLLSGYNECFFRVAPLKNAADELLFPALLNCSKIVGPDGRARSWVCSQYVNFAALARERDLHRRLCASFEALRHCLLETGFNYSSEHHEGTSWFTESAHVDPRVSTAEKWQEATAQDPLFVLEVPWLKTGLSLTQTVDAIFKQSGAPRPNHNSAAALARVVLNQTSKPTHPASWIHHEMLELLPD